MAKETYKHDIVSHLSSLHFTTCADNDILYCSVAEANGREVVEHYLLASNQ